LTKDRYEKPEITTEVLEPGVLLCAGSQGPITPPPASPFM